MKKTILPFCLLSASVLAAFAQESKPATAVITTTPTTPAKQTPEVGISARDGITLSGRDLMVTRNGVMEKLTKVLELPNGTRVEPNGTITTPEGAKVVLRPTQLLTFDGRFVNVPIVESVPPATTTTTTTTTAPAAPAVVPVAPAVPATTEKSRTAEEAAALARAEAERRAKAAEPLPK